MKSELEPLEPGMSGSFGLTLTDDFQVFDWQNPRIVADLRADGRAYLFLFGRLRRVPRFFFRYMTGYTA